VGRNTFVGGDGYLMTQPHPRKDGSQGTPHHAAHGGGIFFFFLRGGRWVGGREGE
jgi:hypothetical protein